MPYRHLRIADMQIHCKPVGVGAGVRDTQPFLG